MIDLATWLALIMASCSAAHFLLNARLFHRAPRPVETAVEPVAQFPSVSVLIPARDEEAGLAETIRCVLASEGCGFELVVLDDHSQDQTAAIVRRFAAEDDRVRLAVGKPLPSGWCGKQFACFQLAQQARGDLLLFLDADVRLAPDAIRRMVALRQTHNVALLSGFPTQVVGTLAEALLIPLMHLVLLTYLPFRRMRATCRPSTSAGCGQMFLATRAAYERAGGHAAIRNSMHDGLTLPRAFRQAGLTTDVFDASDLARCRMYQGWRQTQKGVLKNAHEGIAQPRLIVPFTVLLLGAFVAPSVLAVLQLAGYGSILPWALLSLAISFVPRIVMAARFDHSWLATALFPVSILLFVALQWVAFVRQQRGTQPEWRGRSYSHSP